MHAVIVNERKYVAQDFNRKARDGRQLVSKARILSSRRAMSRSMILRVTSNGSPVKHEVSVSSMENTIGFLVEKKTCLEPCDLFNTEEARASAKLL